jgi:hypothetical protein
VVRVARAHPASGRSGACLPIHSAMPRGWHGRGSKCAATIGCGPRRGRDARRVAVRRIRPRSCGVPASRKGHKTFLPLFSRQRDPYYEASLTCEKTGTGAPPSPEDSGE